MIEIPFLSDLLTIFQRDVQNKNEILTQRKDLAAGLVSIAEAWTKALLHMLEDAMKVCEREGPEAARRIIQRQQEDFHTIDYHAIRIDSQVLGLLRRDSRFQSFVEACVVFYDSAIDLKSLAYLHLGTQGRAELETAAQVWKERLSEMLERVRWTYRETQILTPK